jgi:6-phosphogluconolactonase
MAETPNPSFLAVSPDRRFLYAVNWRGSETVEGNTVSAYGIDAATGALTFLNKVSSQGEMPTHLAVDATGKTLVVVNYGTGTVTALPIQADGRLAESTFSDTHTGPSVHREPGPHAHGVVFSPDNQFAFSADVGMDRVYAYRHDVSTGAVSSNDPPYIQVEPGRGPRHLAIHPSGRFLFVNNEQGRSVTSFQVEGGTLKEIQTIPTVPPDVTQGSTAEIQISGDGRFLYVSNRGHDSIAVFAVDSAAGTLTPVEHVLTQGRTPRNFSLDLTGTYMFAANQNSSTIVLFRVDPETGRLTPAGEVLEVPFPVCVLFVKAG